MARMSSGHRDPIPVTVISGYSERLVRFPLVFVRVISTPYGFRLGMLWSRCAVSISTSHFHHTELIRTLKSGIEIIGESCRLRTRFVVSHLSH